MIVCFCQVIPNHVAGVAVEVAAHDYRFSIEPFRMSFQCIASLSDVAGLLTSLDSRRPDCKQEKVRRPAYPDGNDPFALGFSEIKNSPRLGDQNSEALLWVLSEPAP